MSQYDVKLNGKGYMLAKDAEGRLISGAAREQRINPFTQHFSTGERWARTEFRFGDGAGAAVYDGTHRYMDGQCVDSRSGRVMLGAGWHLSTLGGTERRIATGQLDELLPLVISSNGSDPKGIAERFQAATGKTAIRSVVILVKRKADRDYGTANDWIVELFDDTTGPKPNTSLGSKAASLKAETDGWLPFPDRWRNEDWFWHEVVFDTDISITAGNYYWLAVKNNQAPEVYIGDSDQLTQEYRSTWNGTTWTDGVQDSYIYFKIKYADEIDSFPRCFCEFAGTDKIKRLYCGLAYKVMYFDEADDTWKNSKTLTTPVVQLLAFNEKMFAAQGDTNDIWYTDGATATTTWTQVSGHQAQALAIHDNLLWKADGCEVKGSSDGTGWSATEVKVGDVGTPVQALVSHGGKLFAAKPEGIFEISYPDTYPGSGTPAANSMLDFRTELSPRTWLLDWHSALYFPGYAGVYELKSDILRNAWTERFDEGALEVAEAGAQYTRARRWSPIYDAAPGGWAAGCGSTRGLALAYSSPHLNRNGLWWCDGRNWHPTGIDYLYVGEYQLAVHIQDLGGGRGRLWFGSGCRIAYYKWPTWTNDRATDDNADFDASRWGLVYLPRFSLNTKRDAINFHAVGISTRQATSNRKIDISYALDGDIDADSFTLLGTVTQSPYAELIFPTGTNGREIQLQAKMWPYGSDASVILDQIDLLYQPLSETVTTHQLIIHAAKNLPRHGGAPDPRSAKEILTELRALPDLATAFAYVDLQGNSHTARVSGMTVQNLRQEKRPDPSQAEAYAIVTLLEV